MKYKLRGGIIGSGVFGTYYAKKHDENEQVTLTAVYDIVLNNAKKVAIKYNAKAFNDLNLFLKEVDIVIVASPARTHFANAAAALLANKSVLVEKPVAVSLSDADMLIALAKAQKCILAVGHQERIVFEGIGLFNIPERPTLIQTERVGSWSGRGADVSVTLDLLIHDLDLVISILRESDYKSIKAYAKCVHTKLPDEITTNIIFESGVIVKLHASRTAKKHKRNMIIEYPSGLVEIDFMDKTFKNTTPFILNQNFVNTNQGKDPLAANFSRFIDAVIKKDSLPIATGRCGRKALKLALAIDEISGFRKFYNEMG